MPLCCSFIQQIFIEPGIVLGAWNIIMKKKKTERAPCYMVAYIVEEQDNHTNKCKRVMMTSATKERFVVL